MPGSANGQVDSSVSERAVPPGRWARWVAIGLGVGYVPIAPGTAGSLLGVLFYLVIFRRFSPWFYGLVLLGLLVLGWYTSGLAEQAFQRTDPHQIVIDEILGMLLTYFLLPMSLSGMIVGFVFFRLFDVSKPPPLRSIQRWPGGAGIMLDDVGAAFYAHFLTRWVLGWLG